MKRRRAAAAAAAKGSRGSKDGRDDNGDDSLDDDDLLAEYITAAQPGGIGGVSSSSSRRRRLVPLLCSLLGLLLYAGTAFGPTASRFPYDDVVAVLKNRDVLDVQTVKSAHNSVVYSLDGPGGAPSTHWYEVFRHDFWGKDVNDKASHKSYRPVTVLTYRWDAWLARTVRGAPGADNPAVFHLTNALLYAATCWLVVSAVLLPAAGDTGATGNAGGVYGGGESAALLAGAWFASHPAHVEAVAPLAGRSDVLAALFCLLGYTAWKGGGGGHNGGRTGRALIAAACFLTACLCKETSAAVPFVLAGLDALPRLAVRFISRRPGVAPASARGKSGKNKRSGRHAPATTDSTSLAADFSAPVIIASSSAVYLILRRWLFHSGDVSGGTSSALGTEGTGIEFNFVPHLLDPVTKFRTILYVAVAEYVRLIFVPTELSCNYGLGVIDPITTWTSREMAQVAAVGALVAVWIRHALSRACFHPPQSRDTTPLLALGWTFGPLLPACHVLVDIGTVLAERLLFLPTVGGALLLCWALGELGRCITSAAARKGSGGRGRRRAAALVAIVPGGVVAVVIVLFARSTALRTADWTDSNTLFLADVERHPRAVHLLLAAGNALVGKLKEHDTEGAAIPAGYLADALRVLDGYDAGPHPALPSDEVNLMRGKIVPRLVHIKTVAGEYDEAVALADRMIAIGRGPFQPKHWAKVHGKRGRALLRRAALRTKKSDAVDGIIVIDASEDLRDAADAFYLAASLGSRGVLNAAAPADSSSSENAEDWFEINEGKGSAFYRLWEKAKGDGDGEAMAAPDLTEAVDGYRTVLALGDVFGNNDTQWRDVQYHAGRAFFQLGARSAGGSDLLWEAARALDGVVTMGNHFGDAKWRELQEEQGMVLLKLAPATRDRSLLNDAIAAISAAIESAEEGYEAAHLFCMHGTALAMLDRKEEAHEQFRECLRRDGEGGEGGVMSREDRFSYRLNHAVLLRKLSGVETSDAGTAKVWGTAAMAAFEEIMAWPGEDDGDDKRLSVAQLEEWTRAKAILTQLLI